MDLNKLVWWCFENERLFAVIYLINCIERNIIIVVVVLNLNNHKTNVMLLKVQPYVYKIKSHRRRPVNSAVPFNFATLRMK